MKGRVHIHIQTDGIYNGINDESYEISSSIIDENGGDEYHIKTETVSSFSETSAVTGASAANNDIIHQNNQYINRNSKISYSSNDDDNFDDDCKITHNMSRVILEEAKNVVLVTKNKGIDSRGGDGEETFTRNISSCGYWSDPEQ